ncbi:MAG: RNA polymerase sigma factor [Pseudomonadota bacterium]
MTLSDLLERDATRFQRFLLARTRDPALAEDLMQEARLKLINQAPAGDIANPVPYIFQMLANMVEDHRRSERSREARGRAWGDRGEGLEPNRAEHITPEITALDRDMLEQTMAALDELPEKTRVILLAYRVEGKPQKQIAAENDLSLSSVEKHLQRGYRALVDIRNKLDAGFG